MGRVVGLDDVVVGAGIQQLDDQALIVARGGDDDRHLAGRPDHAEQPLAADVRQPEVENDGLRVLGEHRLQAAETVRSTVDRVPATEQIASDRGADARIVLDE